MRLIRSFDVKESIILGTSGKRSNSKVVLDMCFRVNFVYGLDIFRRLSVLIEGYEII